MNVIKILIHIILFSVLLQFSSIAQNPNLHSEDTTKSGRLKKLAKSAQRFGDTYSAIDFYGRYLKLRPEDAKITYHMGKLILATRDYVKAEIWFKKAYDLDSLKNKTALYDYALMQKMNGKYDDANKSFHRFLTIMKGDKEEKTYKLLADNEIKGCDRADSLINHQLKVIVSHLDTSINRGHREFSPMFIDSTTMIYGSLKADSLDYYDVNGIKKRPVAKIYVAKSKNDYWIGTDQFSFFNDSTNKYNTGNGAFSPDHKRFYFTKCETNWQNKTTCAIYVSSVNENGAWQKPVALPNSINTPNYTATQPSIGKESKTNADVLYFSSDRPGGHGGLDIWYSEYDKDKNTYKAPKNCGKEINTTQDEMTPYYHVGSKVLFFSTAGFPSLGGLDVFKANGELGSWGKAENFGYPINSSTDDLYFVLDSNKVNGFFVSNRKGGITLKNATCCDDIYSIKLTDYFFYLTLKGKLYKMEYIDNILDLTSNQQLSITKDKYLVDSAIVSLFMMYGDPPKSMLVGIDTTNVNGEYYFKLEKDKNYKLAIEKEGYFNRQFYFTTKEMTTKDTITQSFGMNELTKGPIVIKNIYYPFDESYLTPEAKMTIDTTLLQLIKDNPKLVIEIASHTDSKGSDDYNEKLSQRRAQSVVDYLVKNGIDEKRLQAKGYGETTPIALNNNADGSDNPDGRAKNRRTEFKIIGTVDKYSNIIYKQ